MLINDKHTKVKMLKTIHFSTIGCGRLGTNLTIRLKKAGHVPVGISARHLDSIKSLNNIIEAQSVDTIPWKVTTNADVIFITTPDDYIQTVCQQLVDNKGFNPNAIVYHCSGSLPSTVLDGARSVGLKVGSFHPLQSFPSKQMECNPFEGIFVSVEGDPIAVKLGKKIADDLKADVVEISTNEKKLYHAAAVVASNYLVTLLDMAKQFNIKAGMPENIALKVLKPLIQGTLSNIEQQGIPDALTGPVSRGDIQTIKNHIEDINKKLPDFLKLYKILGTHTVPIAKSKKTISDKKTSSLIDLFDQK